MKNFNIKLNIYKDFYKFEEDDWVENNSKIIYFI